MSTATRNPAPTDHLDLATLFGVAGQCSAIRQIGYDLTVEHIIDGDYLVIEHRGNPVDGERVVVKSADGASYVRRYASLPDGSVLLSTAEPDVAPLRLKASQVHIIGVVVGVIRRMSGRAS